MTRGLLALTFTLLVAAPADATVIPLLDLPPGVKAVALGLDDRTLHGSFDMALWGWGQGWTAGVAGGFDHATPYARDTAHMVALRVARRMWGTWPLTIGLMLSAGANLVDPDAPLPKKTSQRFTSDYLLWAQPAVVFATNFQDEKLWMRGSLGPVIGRWSEGTYLLPYIVPNVEITYRYTPQWELVLGGSYSSLWSVGLRTAF